MKNISPVYGLYRRKITDFKIWSDNSDKIAKNEALMALRKKSNQNKYRNIRKDESVAGSPEEIYLMKELDSKYERILFSLPEKCRVIFCMSRIEKMTYQQIADALGLSIKTIETQIGRALSVFRKELSRIYPEYFKK